MESLLKSQFSTEQESKSPIFYFENEEEIYLYQAKRGYILCASALKESLESLESFKMEFLVKAIELIEKPDSKVSLVIKQE